RRLKVGHGGHQAPQRSREAGPQGGRDVADPQPWPVARAARRHPRRLGMTEHPVCLREQGGSRVRQGNLSLRAVEQPYPELILELAYLSRDRGLGDVQSLRRPAEMQLLGDGDEISEMTKL